MRNQLNKIVSLLLVALVSICFCGTALAQAPDRSIHSNFDVRGTGNVCAEDADQDIPPASSSPNIEAAVDVKLQKGKLKLYDVENKTIAQINVAGEGDTGGIIVIPDRPSSAGMVTFQKSSAQMLRKAEIDGTEITLVPIRVEYTDTAAAKDAFDAYIDRQSILNFEELALTYQDWQQALPAETPGPQYAGISTTVLGKNVQDVSEGTKTRLSSIEQLIQKSKLELYQLAGIGASVLLATILLTLWLVHAKKNRKKLQALIDLMEEQNRTILQTSAAVSDIDKRLNEVAKETVQGNERLNSITRSLQQTSKPKSPVDQMKEFLERVNGITAVNAPDQWRQSLMEYRPEFLKYDAIQRWFSREGGIGDPLFAVCSIPSSNESQLCLIPSCYDTKLASGDLPVAYDVIKPMSGESIRTYKIDRAAVLEPYGVYFRIVSRGQITLLP